MLLRLVTIFLSLALHAALLLPFVSFGSGEALESGSGNDLVVVEQGIAIEGLAKLGEAEEMIETVDIPPIQAAQAPSPVQQVQPEEEPVETPQPVPQATSEIADVIAATESSHEEQVVSREPKPMEEEPPEVMPKEQPPEEKKTEETVAEEPKPVETEQPEAIPVEEQAPQVATLVEQSSGAAQQGGDTTKRLAYLGQVRKTLERHKVNPRSGVVGTVLLRFTVGAQGEIISSSILRSSGSKLLDDAAMASLERAAPFPPLPQEIAHGSIEVQVPFRFITR